ncbi:MAG: hypothetical protein GY943_04075 [Chloroflexi bacterium]|nr:hypothetical protein [Chloroflexota bacterium]
MQDSLMTLLRILAGLMGLFIVGGTLISAIKTFILPRGINVWLTAVIFRTISFFFQIRVKNATYDKRDRVMALFAPITLFIMPIVFLGLVLIGYMFLFWAMGMTSIYEMFRLSGSSLLTLGYASVDEPLFKLLEFSEATIGLILVALLIAYLPTMYAAFSSREANVALLEGYAGSPPSVLQFIARSHRTGELGNLREVWLSWQRWFAELEESHTSLAPLSYFRSPNPDRSWVTAAGVVLDTAAFILTAVDVPYEPRAAFCIRSGFLALNQIADFFEIPHPANPDPTDPISISRIEFDKMYDDLLQRGVPMRTDRDGAWQNFSGWRVNYDMALLSLAALTMAPYAEWVSDRSAVPYLRDS